MSRKTVDYSKGKIYTIQDDESGKAIYVGSTTQSLSRRWSRHKDDVKTRNYPIYQHMREKGIENFHIELYEIHPCGSKEELTKKEYEVMRVLKKGNDLKNKHYNFNNICEHDTDGRDCAICEGSGVCEHKRTRRKCVECQGSQICEHKRRRYRCNDCKNENEKKDASSNET